MRTPYDRPDLPRRVSPDHVGGVDVDRGLSRRARAERLIRFGICVLVRGEHEFYKVLERDRIYQRCVNCGHTSRGWDVRPAFRYWSTWMR